MPRGGTDESRGLLTDTAGNAAFSSSIESQYGIHPNAEALIEAHRAMQDPALQKASLIQVNADATEEAKSDLKGSARKLGLKDGDGELVDVSVRGNALVGVVEYPDGTVGKVVGGWTDDWKAPELTGPQAAQQASARAEAEQNREIARLQAQFQEQLSEKAAELQEQMTSEIEKIRDAAQKEVAKAQEDAEKASEKSSSSSRGSSSRKSSSRRGSSRKKTSSRSAGKATQADTGDESGSNSGVGASIADGVRTPEEKKNETSGL